MRNKKLVVITLTLTTLLLAGGVSVHNFLQKTSLDDPIDTAQPLSHGQFETAKTKLVQLLEEKDPSASFSYLRSAIKEDASLARDCHPLLHHLGHAVYEKYKNFTKTISYEDGLCNSGYTHGSIEAHFMNSSDIHTALKTTCYKQNDETAFKQWQCYHGIGHGVMYFTDKNLDRSLTLCSELPTDFARNSCVNGVFMERFIIVNHSGLLASGTNAINVDLCKQQTENHKADCYLYAPTAYLERNTNDYTGALRECETNAERAYLRVCIRGVGSQAVKENITKPEVARDICKKASREYVKPCIEGAIDLLINHHASTVFVGALCQTVFSDFKETCIQAVVSWNLLFTS